MKDVSFTSIFSWHKSGIFSLLEKQIKEHKLERKEGGTVDILYSGIQNAAALNCKIALLLTVVATLL